MRSLKALVALGLLASVITLGTQAASASAIDSGAFGPSTRPAQIDFVTSYNGAGDCSWGCTWSLVRLTWSSWGTASAFGTGIQDLPPSSSSESFNTAAVDVILSNPIYGNFALLTVKVLSSSGGPTRW